MGTISAMQELKEIIENHDGDNIPKHGLLNVINLMSLEKEKQQTIDTYKQGHEDGYHFEGSQSDYEAEGLYHYLSEKYYNETFKQD